MKRRAFTLIELLVVIGIILVLMSIIVAGFRHVHQQGASRETGAELQVCRDLLQEYENVNGRGNIEQINATPTSAGAAPTNPPAYNAFPVYVDNPVGATTEAPLSAILISDLSVSGGSSGTAADMGDKSPGLNTARYNAPAVRRTYDVMFLLLRDPKNRALVSSMPPKRLLEGQTSMSGTQAPTDISHAVLLDGYGNPIIYVPVGGIHVMIVDSSSGGAKSDEYVVRSTGMFLASQLASHPISAADRPFWASAGQDGDFTKGDDNIYSFELK